MNGVTYGEAAVQVLQAAGEPLTAEQIVREAIRQRLIRPRGKTPVRTMTAVLYVDTPKAVTRIFEKGLNRARRGTVRWVVR